MRLESLNFISSSVHTTYKATHFVLLSDYTQPSLAPSTNDSSGDFTEQSSQTTSSMQYLPPALAGCSSTAQPKNSPVKDVSSNNHVRYLQHSLIDIKN